MPWQEVSKMSLKQEFVSLASADGANVAELCRRFGISRQTGYEYLRRFKEEGLEGLKERSKRPHQCPHKVLDSVEQAVLNVRREHPVWGGRKIRARLLALQYPVVPSASTITAILRRHQLLDPGESSKHQAWQRFEHEAPNQLWQMDFKGHFETLDRRCHPLTILDDHSRYSLCIQACANEQASTVRTSLIEVFRRYGLPERMTMDNGGPWGSDSEHPYTALTLWLIRLGIRVGHSRPYHPQTQGKDERFHRTLKAEVLQWHSFRDLTHCQEHFDHWRAIYNHQRPHESLGNQVPASRYMASKRPYPEQLPPLEYGPDDDVRKVQAKGEIHYKGQVYRVGTAFKGLHVGIRPTNVDGKLEVYFCHQQVAEIDLHQVG